MDVFKYNEAMHKNGIVVAFLVIFIILLASAAAYFFISGRVADYADLAGKKELPRNIKGRDSAAERKAAEWTQYDGRGLNAQFKYPRDWQIRTPEGYNAEGKYWSMEIGKVLCCQLEFGNGMSLQITHYLEDDGQCLSSEQALKEVNDFYGEGFSREKYSYNGFQGAKAETEIDDQESIREEHINLFQKKDGGCYFLSWNAIDPDGREFKHDVYLSPILDSFETRPVESKDQVIRELLGQKYQDEAQKPVIEKEDEEHMRGQVNGKIFLAAKKSGEWLLVFDGSGTINCLDIKQYGFSPSMIPECLR